MRRKRCSSTEYSEDSVAKTLMRKIAVDFAVVVAADVVVADVVVDGVVVDDDVVAVDPEERRRTPTLGVEENRCENHGDRQRKKTGSPN